MMDENYIKDKGRKIIESIHDGNYYFLKGNNKKLYCPFSPSLDSSNFPAIHCGDHCPLFEIQAHSDHGESLAMVTLHCAPSKPQFEVVKMKEEGINNIEQENENWMEDDEIK